MPRVEVKITKKSDNYLVRVLCLGPTSHWKRMVFARDVPLEGISEKVVALMEDLPRPAIENVP